MVIIRTVRKNSKKQLDQIFQNGSFTVHTLDNKFVAEKVKGSVAEKEYKRFKFSKVTINADERTGYVNFHSNYWYKFKLPKKLKR